MRKIFFTLLLGLFAFSHLMAQNTPPNIPTLPNTTKKDFQSQIGKRWVWGGNFSLIFKPFLLDLSPTLGYRLNQSFTAGIGIGGIYNRNQLKDSTISKTVFTGRAFTQVQLWKIINAQVEYELMQSNVRNEETKLVQRKLLANPLAGGGLRLPIFAGVSLQVSVLYNFNYQKEFSPYPSPWIFRMGLGR
jgi:hypothetical protein